MRQKILDLLAGRKVDVQPAFSGLIHVTLEGLESEGLTFHEIHKDAHRMAKSAASTFRTTGMPSATLPLDLCLPAEALGAELNYHEDGVVQFPQVKTALVKSTREIDDGMIERAWTLKSGRISMACEAIELTRNDIGREAVICGMIPGPYTLLVYLCDPLSLFQEMKKEPSLVQEALLNLSSYLAQIGNAYLHAGADFITIHDMGGSPGFIGPARYEQLVLPAERSLIAKVTGLKVLSVCGNVTGSLKLFARTGADAISLDQTVDMAVARAELKDNLLFGNIDPVQTLWQGKFSEVAEAVQRAKKAGVDAVWPGCDLIPQTPIQNLNSMLA